MPTMTDFIVTEKASRPAGRKDICFYCNQPVGQPHRTECVYIKRRWRVRVTVEIDIERPADWPQHMVEFHLNDSSWCASNIGQEIVDYVETGPPCLCGSFEAEILERKEETFLDEG